LKRLIASFLIALIIIFNCSAIAEVKKSGILSQNETWQGEIFLEGDVVVPEDLALEIKKGTLLFYEQKDLKNYGQDDTRPELVIYGDLILPENLDSVRYFHNIPLDSSTRILKIEPYQVDTQILRDEFHWFSVQYVLMWSILTYALVNAVGTI